MNTSKAISIGNKLASKVSSGDGKLPSSYQASKQLHPNAIRALRVLTPKRFVFQKKKVKRFTSLKKKILMVSIKY
jgi:hypothetical protein